MAKNTETLTIKVDADTRAADRKISALDKDLEQLGGGHGSKTTIKVDANTDAATRTIKDLIKDVDKLDAEHATIELKLAEQNLGRQLADIVEQVGKLGASDTQIDIKMAQGDALIADIDHIESKIKEIASLKAEAQVGLANSGQVIGDLEQVEGKVQEIDGLKAEVQVEADTSQLEGGLGRAKGDTEKLKDSARGAHSALANMIGNSAQDLGAMGGVAQSAGVAIGQMAEYASDATLAGEGLGSALGSMAAVALPILGLSVGMGLITKAMSSASAKSKELAENVGQATQAFEDGIGSIDDWGKAVDDAFASGTGSSADEFSRQVLNAMEKATDTETVNSFRLALSALGLTLDDLGSVTVSATDNFANFAESSLKNKGNWDDISSSVDGVVAAVGPLIDQFGNADEVVSALGESVTLGVTYFDQYGNAVPTDEIIKFVQQNKDLINSLDDTQEATNALQLEKTAQQFLDLEASVSDATKAMVEQARATDRNGDGIVTQTEALQNYIDAQKQRNQADAEGARIGEQEAAQNQALLQTLRDTRAETERMTFTQQELRDALLAAQDPMETLPTTWATLINDMRDGNVDVTRMVRLINELAAATGKEPGEIFAIIKQQADAANQAVEDQAIATADAIGKVRDAQAAAQSDAAAKTIDNITKAFEAQTTATGDAIGQLHDMQTSIRQAGQDWDEAGARAQAFAAGLEAINANSEISLSEKIFAASDAVNSFGQALQDAKDNGVDFASTDFIPDSWSEVRNMDEDLKPLVGAFAAMRGQIQTELTDAFNVGGRPEFNRHLADIRTAVIEQLSAAGIQGGAAFDQAMAALGLDQKTIDILIKVEGEEDARQKIDIILSSLQGIPEEEVLNIRAEAQIDPQQALADLISYVQNVLHLDIPASLLPTIDPGAGAGARASLDDLAAGHTVEFGPQVDPQANRSTNTTLDDTAEDRTATYNTETPDADATNARLDGVATGIIGRIWPGGRGRVATYHSETPDAAATSTTLDNVAKPRTANILVKANDAGAVNRMLNEVARDRTSNIFIVTHSTTVSSGGSTSGGGGGATPSGFAAPVETGRLAAFAAPADTGVSSASTTASTLVLPTLGAPVTNNYSVSVNAAVIGNRFEVDRAVSKAVRRTQRINGRRVAA